MKKSDLAGLEPGPVDFDAFYFRQEFRIVGVLGELAPML
jgi:hypothetical protein